jgi:hypothetical protein
MIEHDFITQERIRETGQHLLKRYGFNDRWSIPEHDELFEIGVDFNELDTVYDELEDIWLLFWHNGFALWGFELHAQSNETIVLTNFKYTGFRMTSGCVSIVQPDPQLTSQRFFDAPCFPTNFVANLRAKGFEVPTDCFPSVKTDTD